jgi:hypothetical protein
MNGREKLIETDAQLDVLVKRASVIMIQNGNYPTIFKLETKRQKISNDIQFMYYEINKRDGTGTCSSL